MKRLSKILLIVIAFHLALTFFTHRGLLLTRFDPDYWQERFEFSQWQLPGSPRTIGDDGLYLYAGWRLAQGDDPTTINPEMPPMAKYLIGFSARFLGNGALLAFGQGLAAIGLFFLLARKLFTSTSRALLATALLALDPLFTSQLYQTMLDLSQLVFLIIFFLVLAKHPSSTGKTEYFRAIALGAAFGFFSVTKLPVYSPFLVIIAAGFYLKKKDFVSLALFFLTAAFCGLGAYGRYFSTGHSLFDWLSLQKWILAFYAKSGLPPNYASALTTLMVNKYQNLFSRGWETVNFWTPAWPAAVGGGLIGLGRKIVNKKPGKTKAVWTAVGFFTISVLAVNCLVPFWPRYLVVLLPFLYLGLISAIGKLTRFKLGLIGLLVAANLATSLGLNFPTPKADFKQISHDWAHGFFDDLYQNTTTAVKNEMSREDFGRLGRRLMAEAEIEMVQIETSKVKWTRFSPQVVPITVTYYTRRLGPFTEKKEVSLVKEAGAWRVSWRWDWLFSDLKPKDSLKTEVIEAKRGAILAPNREPLAEDAPGFLVSIVPEKVDTRKESEMLAFLETLFGGKLVAVNIHQRYVGAAQPDRSIPIGALSAKIITTRKETLTVYPGIVLSPQLVRTYYPNPTYEVGDVANTRFTESGSWLYSTTNYDGVSGIELEKNNRLKGFNGGSLVIENENGETVRKILEIEKQDGGNVQL